MQYQVIMERFWGLKETVGIYATVQDAIKALQVKKHAINNSEVVFTITTVRGN
jgi:hypothetical protein